jgi:hypothetical protein
MRMRLRYQTYSQNAVPLKYFLRIFKARLWASLKFFAIASKIFSIFYPHSILLYFSFFRNIQLYKNITSIEIF